MGVYNPKATMPRSCFDCGYNDGITCEYLETDCYIVDYAQTERIHPDCPLVEVKAPHGRLGDLDQLEKFMLFVTDDQNCPIYLAAEAEQIIGTMPIIIEAEGKDDG